MKSIPVVIKVFSEKALQCEPKARMSEEDLDELKKGLERAGLLLPGPFSSSKAGIAVYVEGDDI